MKTLTNGRAAYLSMPRRLSEDEIDEIIETYEETEDLEETAEETGRSYNTVKKYVQEWENEQRKQEQEPEDPMEEVTLDFGEVGLSEAEASGEVDFRQLTPGEFVEWFFEDELEQIDVKSVEFFSKRCDSLNAVPSWREMMNLLNDLPSEVSNNTQIEWLADMYWSEAKAYLSANLGMSEEEIQSWVSNNGVPWVRLDDASANDRYRDGSNTRAAAPPTSRSQPEQQSGGVEGPAMPPSAQNAPEQSHNGGVQSPPVPQGQDGAGSSTEMLLMQMMEEMREERKQMLQAIQSEQNGGGGSGEDFMEQMQKMMQFQQQMDALSEGDEEDLQEFANVIGAELGELKQMMAEDGGPTPSGDDPMAMAMMQMSQRQDADPETIASMMKAVNVEADPEVQKKKWDFQTEKMKMERKKEMADAFLDNMEEFAGGLSDAASAIESLSGDEEPQEPAEPDPEMDGPIDGGEAFEDEPEMDDEDDDFTLGDYSEEPEEEPESELETQFEGPPETSSFERGGVVGAAQTEDHDPTAEEVAGDMMLDEARAIAQDQNIDSQDYLAFSNSLKEEGYSEEDVSSAWETLRADGTIPKGSRSDKGAEAATDGGEAANEGEGR